MCSASVFVNCLFLREKFVELTKNSLCVCVGLCECVCVGVGVCGYGCRYVCCSYPAFQKRGSDKHTQVFVCVCVCCVCAPAFARPKRGSDKHTQVFFVYLCV